METLKPLVEQRVLQAMGLIESDRGAVQRRIMKALCAARKQKDSIDLLLIKELREEEPSWVDYEQDADTIKTRIVNSLMGVLITDVFDALLPIIKR